MTASARYSALSSLVGLLLAFSSSLTTAAAASKSSPLAERARAQLTADLSREKAFVKVHAAEALIALGEKAEPHRVFMAELPAANDARPYRIGVWRVLALSSKTPAERAEWIARVEAVVLDEATMDRVHAVETLGKLGHGPSGGVRAAVEQMAKHPGADAVFANWVLHLAGDRTALAAIVAALASEDPAARLRAAFVLHWLKITNAATRAALDRTAEKEPADAVGYIIINAAAVGLDANPARTPARVAILEKALASGSAGARYYASQALMRRYTSADFPKLAPLLDDAEGDARIGAAWAILYITAARK